MLFRSSDYAFDGISQYMMATNGLNTGSNNFSVSLWVRPYRSSAIGQQNFYVSMTDSNDVGWSIGYNWNNSSTFQCTFVLNDTNGFGGVWATAANSYTNGMYNWVVEYFNSNQSVNIYINNKLILNQADASGIIMNNTNNIPIYIGVDNTNYNHYAYGNIGDVRIFNRILSLSEITNLNVAGSTVTNGIVYWWKMNDTTNVVPITIAGAFNVNGVSNKQSTLKSLVPSTQVILNASNQFAQTFRTAYENIFDVCTTNGRLYSSYVLSTSNTCSPNVWTSAGYTQSSFTNIATGSWTNPAIWTQPIGASTNWPTGFDEAVMPSSNYTVTVHSQPINVGTLTHNNGTLVFGNNNYNVFSNMWMFIGGSEVLGNSTNEVCQNMTATNINRTFGTSTIRMTGNGLYTNNNSYMYIGYNFECGFSNKTTTLAGGNYGQDVDHSLRLMGGTTVVYRSSLIVTPQSVNSWTNTFVSSLPGTVIDLQGGGITFIPYSNGVWDVSPFFYNAKFLSKNGNVSLANPYPGYNAQFI